MSEVQVGGIKVKLEADASGVTRGVNSAKTSLDSLGAASQKIGASLGAISLGAAAVAASMAVAGKAMYSYTQQGLDMVDVQAKAAREIGSTINGLKSLKNAAQYAGVSTEQLYDSTRKLNDSLGKINMGSKEVATALSKLNIKPEDILPLDVDQRFELIAKRIKELNIGASDVTAILTKLGMTGKNLVGFLSDGGQSIKDARLELEKFNMGVNAAQAARVEKYNDQVTRLKRIADSVKEKVAVQVSPYLSAIAQKIEDQIAMDKKFDESLAKAAKDIATFTNNFITSVGLLQAAIDTLADISVKVVDEIPVPRVDKLVTGQMSVDNLTKDLKKQNTLGKIAGTAVDWTAEGVGQIYKGAYGIGSSLGEFSNKLFNQGAISSSASPLLSSTADVPSLDKFVSGFKYIDTFNDKLKSIDKNIDPKLMTGTAFVTEKFFGKTRTDIKPESNLVWDDIAKRRAGDVAFKSASLAADTTALMSAGTLLMGFRGALMAPAVKEAGKSAGRFSALSKSASEKALNISNLDDYASPYISKVAGGGITPISDVARYSAFYESATYAALAEKAKQTAGAEFLKSAAKTSIGPAASLSLRYSEEAKPLTQKLVSMAAYPFSQFSEYSAPGLLAGERRQAGISKIYADSLADIYKEDSISRAKTKIGKAESFDLLKSQLSGKVEGSFDKESFSEKNKVLKDALELDLSTREEYSKLELELRRKSFEEEFKDMESRLAFLTESFKTEQDLVEEKFSNNMSTLQESFENGLINEEEYLKNVEKLRENHSEVLAEIYAKDNEHEVRRQEEMLTRLEMMADSFKTEEELIREKLANEEVLLKESLDKKLIDEEYYNEMRVKINKDAQDRIDGIRAKEKQSSRAALKGFTSDLASMTATTAGESKKMFELNKMASIANSLLDAHEAISGAYKVGARIGGPGLGAAFAAAAGFAQFARINQIRSTSFGGGAAAAPSSAPASTPSVPSDVAGITGDRAGGLATIQIVGSENAMFTTEQVRGLIEQINDQVDKGMRIKVV